jgi:hypothetical protein
MMAVLDGSTDDSVSVFRSYIQYADVEENSGCWFRKRRDRIRARRSYSLAEPPENISGGRWNQTGFDVHPASPPEFNFRIADEGKTRSSLGISLQSDLSICISK